MIDIDLKLLQELNSAEWTKLQSLMQDRLVAIARNRTHDTCAAEDIVQETWINAVKKINTVYDGKIEKWLCTVLTRECLAWYWRQRRDRALSLNSLAAAKDSDDCQDFGVEAEVLDATDALCMEEARQIVRDAVEELGDENARIMQMWMYDCLAPKEIAEQLGVRPQTIYSRMWRIRNDLSQQPKVLEAWDTRNQAGIGGESLGLSGAEVVDRRVADLRRFSDEGYTPYEAAKWVRMTRKSPKDKADCDAIKDKFFTLCEKHGLFEGSLAELKCRLEAELERGRSMEDVARENHLLLWENGCQPVKWFETVLTELGYEWQHKERSAKSAQH